MGLVICILIQIDGPSMAIRGTLPKIPFSVTATFGIGRKYMWYFLEKSETTSTLLPSPITTHEANQETQNTGTTLDSDVDIVPTTSAGLESEEVTDSNNDVDTSSTETTSFSGIAKSSLSLLLFTLLVLAMSD